MGQTRSILVLTINMKNTYMLSHTTKNGGPIATIFKHIS